MRRPSTTNAVQSLADSSADGPVTVTVGKAS